MTRYLSVFGTLLVHRPLKAGAIAWWWLTGRRVRAVGRLRRAAADLPNIYPVWLALNELPQRTPGPDGEVRAEPELAVHLHLAPLHDAALAQAAIRSVIDQTFPYWTLYVTSPGGGFPADATAPAPVDPRIRVLSAPFATRAAALAAVLKQAKTSHLVPLACDMVLTQDALLAYARARSASGPADVLYADQDERAPRRRSQRAAGRQKPWFKPAWDADLFLAQDYLSAACAIPVDAARQAGNAAACPDDVAVTALLARLLLGAAPARARRVCQVATTTPAGHWRRDNPARFDLVRAIVGEHLGADVAEGPFGTLAIRRPLPVPAPKVSVIVPTRDRLDLLKPCVEGVLHRTDYPDIELVIADNESIEPETLAYFAHCARDPRVKIVRWPHPYNYSAVNNFAVTHASGPYICLLNNDTEVTDAAWLREMMAHAVRPEVGTVGARLLYPDRSIQHAGVVVGMGGAAGHAHRALPEGEPGYFAQSLVTREATAVTAACLVVAKDKFAAVGGLDEQNLAIAYNDVDLCLKLRAAGWRNIYVAQAVMIHHESKSRGLDFAPEHLARYMRELGVFQERWGTVGFQDPVHHSALDPASEVYRLRL